MESEGSVLETAANFAGISVAFIAVIRTLPETVLAVLDLRPAVMGMMGLVAEFSLLICITSVVSLWNGNHQPRSWLSKLRLSLLVVCCLLLGLTLAVFQSPWFSDWIALVFDNLSKAFG